jgi:hypothetical protein
MSADPPVLERLGARAPSFARAPRHKAIIDAPSALVSTLTRYIVREYALSGRADIPFEEIFDKLTWEFKKDKPLLEMNVKLALWGAVQAHELTMKRDFSVSTIN